MPDDKTIDNAVTVTDTKAEPLAVPTVPPAPETTPAPPETPNVRPEDDPDPGAVFVRVCPGCGKHVQTSDSSGRGLCMVCRVSPEAKARAAAAAPPIRPVAQPVGARRRGR